MELALFLEAKLTDDEEILMNPQICVIVSLFAFGYILMTYFQHYTHEIKKFRDCSARVSIMPTKRHAGNDVNILTHCLIIVTYQIW